MGSNNESGLPLISLRTRYWQYYSPSPFKIFTPIAYLYASNITFSPTLAGQDTIITLNIGQSVNLQKNDIFEISLPSFWSTSYTVALNSTSSPIFSVEWLPCSTLLRLIVVNMTESVSFFTVSVSGLRLPVQGVNKDLGEALTVSSNGSLGEILQVRKIRV
jgi:hypothetical protein